MLLGPSGAGKTTTLRLIAGLERPDAGRIRMDGHDITDSLPASRDCAFVFQQYSLYPHLTRVRQPRVPAALAAAAPRRRPRCGAGCEEVAALLHIEGKLARRATELSGGEMQRVAIGRALVRRPRVFLMDEPLSSLDAQLREELRVELRRLQRATGATVIYVTHDHVEATTMADRIGILERGVLQQVGTPMEVYGDPRTLPVAQRLGSPAINVLPAELVRRPRARRHRARRRSGPRTCALSADGEAPGFQVIECSLVKHQLVAERQGVEVHARVMLDQPLAPGSQARFGFPAEHCLFFDAAGRRIAAPGQRSALAAKEAHEHATHHRGAGGVQAAILANESQIESLDRAIGDGDHFINVRRGCDVLMAMRDGAGAAAAGGGLRQDRHEAAVDHRRRIRPADLELLHCHGQEPRAASRNPTAAQFAAAFVGRRRSHQEPRQGRPGREDDARRADPGVAAAAAAGRRGRAAAGVVRAAHGRGAPQHARHARHDGHQGPRVLPRRTRAGPHRPRFEDLRGRHHRRVRNAARRPHEEIRQRRRRHAARIARRHGRGASAVAARRVRADLRRAARSRDEARWR